MSPQDDYDYIYTSHFQPPLRQQQMAFPKKSYPPPPSFHAVPWGVMPRGVTPVWHERGHGGGINCTDWLLSQVKTHLDIMKLPQFRANLWWSSFEMVTIGLTDCLGYYDIGDRTWQRFLFYRCNLSIHPLTWSTW